MLAHDLLKAGLSRRGCMTATSIMDPETVLGTPGSRDPWGWRVEGHHISLDFTIVNGTLVAPSPTFFGSNPAEVREGPKKGLPLWFALGKNAGFPAVCRG